MEGTSFLRRITALVTLVSFLALGVQARGSRSGGSAGATRGGGEGVGGFARFDHPRGVATDASGNVYVADAGNSTIRKITPAGVVTTLAGTAGTSGSADGTGAAARFAGPSGVATDRAGNVYVADTDNHTIRKITAGGLVTTLVGRAGMLGSDNGSGEDARFYYPYGVATDGDGNVYVADTFNHMIRKVTPAGVVTTLAGTAGSPGKVDGTGAAARFNRPYGLATDAEGTVYVADTYYSTIRTITPSGAVATLSGSGRRQGTAGTVAHFNYPFGVATDGAGNVYIADTNNHVIRKLTAAEGVTTLAGTVGSQGEADGTGPSARFREPFSVATDGSGNVYVADTNNHTIRKITSAGVATTLAGVAGSPGRE
jgi:sugar lactone lactonase YvrE